MENVLLALVVLACPIGMGVMMWMMGRGMMGGRKEDAAENVADGEVEALRAEQQRLSAEVERLERERSGDGEVVAR